LRIAALPLLAVLMNCTEGPPPPIPEPDRDEISAGGKLIAVRPLASYEERRRALDAEPDSALLFIHARDRYLHLYLPPRSRGRYRVDFLDVDGRIVDSQNLTAGINLASNEGVTSRKESRYALVTPAGAVAADRSDRVLLSDKLRSLKPEENPTVTINGVGIFVELADSLDLQKRGLMHRPRLSAGDGMLFIYPGPAKRDFWMGNCHFPMDLAFIRSDSILSEIQRMDPGSDRTWSSREPAQFALEVNAGFFDRAGIRPGMRAALPGK
jgi:uncharacterized membrane protein (UPF0127 family)